jgi:hypothetical protein
MLRVLEAAIKQGFPAEPVPVSACVESSKNLKDLKDQGALSKSVLAEERYTLP